MGRYDFVSPGAMAGNAIEEFLLKREALKRQAMLDQLKQQSDVVEQGQRSRQLDLQGRQMDATDQDRDAARQQREDELRFRRADTLVANSVPDDPVDATARALMDATGNSGAYRRVPGVVQQGPQIDTQDDVPIYDVTTTPDQFSMRGGSRYLSARASEDARAAQAKATEEERTARAQEAILSREQQGQANRELRAEIAAGANAGRGETRALQNAILEDRLRTSQDKRDASQQQQTQARQIAKGRASETMTLLEGLATFNPDGTATLKPGMANLYGVQNPAARLLPGSDTNVAKATRDRLLSRSVIDFLDEMKQQSRTGATGFGQFTEKELALVQSSVSKLNSGMISDQAAAEELARIYNNVRRTLVDGSPANGVDTPSPTGSGFDAEDYLRRKGIGGASAKPR